MPAFEYRRATWDEVCALGPQGWRLVAVPPIIEVKQLLGQMQQGEPLYTMERETGPADVQRDLAVAAAAFNVATTMSLPARARRDTSGE